MPLRMWFHLTPDAVGFQLLAETAWGSRNGGEILRGLRQSTDRGRAILHGVRKGGANSGGRRAASFAAGAVGE